MSYLLPPVEAWSNWSAIFNDAAVWKPVIDAICAQEGITYQGIEPGYPGTHAVFVLDRKHVVKIFSSLLPTDELEREVLRSLEPNEGIPTPRVESVGTFCDRVEWQYLVMEHLQGEPLRKVRDTIPRQNLLDIAADIGLIVKALHKVDTTPLQQSLPGERFTELVERKRSEAPRQLVEKDIVTERCADEIRELLDATASALDSNAFVLVNGDVHEDHVLLNKRDGRWVVTGLIDFGDAYIGVRDYEWMPLWFSLFDQDVGLWRAFIEAYDAALLTGRELPRRALAWTLLHNFGTDSIVEEIEKMDNAGPIDSLDGLQELLWPQSIVG